MFFACLFVFVFVKIVLICFEFVFFYLEGSQQLNMRLVKEQCVLSLLSWQHALMRHDTSYRLVMGNGAHGQAWKDLLPRSYRSAIGRVKANITRTLFQYSFLSSIFISFCYTLFIFFIFLYSCVSLFILKNLKKIIKTCIQKNMKKSIKRRLLPI